MRLIRGGGRRSADPADPAIPPGSVWRFVVTNLPKLPSLPSVSSTRPLVKCACGCGRLTSRTFAPGHDARLKGGCVRVARGLLSLKQVADAMGKPFADAVKKALADRVLMRRWNVEVPKGASKETVEDVAAEVAEDVELAG